MSSEQLKIMSGKDGRVLLITSLVSSLIMLDSTIVAVSLPAIGHSFGVAFSQLEWVISAYLLTYASLLLGSGAFGDLRGRKLTLIAGLLIFGTASAACGLAPSAILLNIARAVQGVGGAMLLTAALAIIGNTFDGPRRGRAVAIWGAYLGVALTLGPVLGGIITRFLGWRWVFLINVPACAILIVAAAKFIDESRDPKAKRLDWAGIITFSPGLLLLVWALISGNDDGWASPAVLLLFAGAVLFLAAFIVAENKQSRPMIDFQLFRDGSFRGAVFAMIGYGATAQVMVFYLPLYLQNAYGFNPLVAGLAMLPFPLPMILAPRLTLGLSRTWSGRKLLTTGLAITALGNILFWGVAKSGLPYPFLLLP
jgi:EmrB/QacA subfamily drug resistance transporter